MQSRVLKPLSLLVSIAMHAVGDDQCVPLMRTLACRVYAFLGENFRVAIQHQVGTLDLRLDPMGEGFAQADA